MKKILSILVVMLAMINVNAFAEDTYALTSIVENGSVGLTVNDEVVTAAAAGATVKVTVTPNATYSTTSVTAIAYTDWSGAKMPKKAPSVIKDLTMTKVSDNVYTFIMPAAKVQVTAVTEQTAVTSWTIAGTTGPEGGEADVLFGTAWNPALAANDLALNTTTNLYEWKKEDVAIEANTTIYYKITGNHGWDINYGKDGVFNGENMDYVVNEAGNYDVTVTFNAETHIATMSLVKHGAPVVTSWTIAGSLNGVMAGDEDDGLFGKTWDATLVANDLTLNTTTNLYEWKKENVALEATTILYKIVGNHTWDINYGKNGVPGGDDMDYIVTEAGNYDVTVTFNAETHIATMSLVKHGAPVTTTWTVAGVGAIFGSNWDPTDTNNDMVLNTTSNLYEWEKENLTIGAGTAYGLKVVKNHSWDENYGGSGENGNYEFTVAEDGIYTLKITFNESTHAIAHEATKTGEAVITDTYVVAGNGAIVNNGVVWDGTAEENKMTTSDDENYTLTVNNIELTPGTYEYKIVKNNVQWIPEGENKTIEIEEHGIYNITYTYKVTGSVINAEVTQVAKLFVETIPAAEYITCYYANDLKLRVADEDIKFYIATTVTDAQVNITEVTTKEIPANTPFLVYNAAAAEKSLELIDDGTGATPINSIMAEQFKGTNVDKEFDVTGTLDYFVCNGTNFVFVKDSGTLPAHRCWIELSKNAAAKLLEIVIDGGTDGIQNVQSAQQNNGTRYNLAGQRVGNDYKGIVIINGKKMRQ